MKDTTTDMQRVQDQLGFVVVGSRWPRTNGPDSSPIRGSDGYNDIKTTLVIIGEATVEDYSAQCKILGLDMQPPPPFIYRAVAE